MRADNETPERGATEPEVYRSIGTLTRMLHDSLVALGFDRKIEGVVQSLPDARSRLECVARMGGESAETVIGQVESGQARNHELEARAAALAEALARDPGAALDSGQIAEFIAYTRETAAQTDAMLTEILMAQSFHDLSAQMVMKVTDLGKRLEEELVRLLVQITPSDAAVRSKAGELDGPVFDTKRADVVTSQGQVDDLLESLGF